MQKTIQLWLDNTNITDLEKNEIKALPQEQLEDAFYKDVEFGTAGMRGLMGVGTNRINTHTIKRATLAFAMYINSQDVNKRVAIAYDNRNNSKLFAEVAANVLASQNIEVYVYDQVMATPLLSYAVRELNCGGGINITASHNPKEYNGFKVYNDAGCQLIPEQVDIVIKNVDAIENYLDIDTELDHDKQQLIQAIDNALIETYIETILKHQYNLNNNEDFSVVYSPQHGAGINVIPEVLKRAHYNYHIVQAQATLDGNFSNTLSPNPENPDAYIEAINLAKETSSKLVVTTDPDADRVGIAVLHNNEYVLLNGNETTAIILYYVLSERSKKNDIPKDALIINTVVTSDLGEEIAKAFNTKTLKTLTGFKYIGTLMDQGHNLDNYIYGYEESYGSLPVPLVRDKDAVSATLLLCEMSAYYDKQGMSLIDLLEKIYLEFGYFKDQQESVSVSGMDGAAKIKSIMAKFENETVRKISDLEIEMIENYNTSIRTTASTQETMDFESANVIKIYFKDTGWISIRPSGTEPIIKFYYCAKGDHKESCDHNLNKLKNYVKEITL